MTKEDNEATTKIRKKFTFFININRLRFLENLSILKMKIFGKIYARIVKDSSFYNLDSSTPEEFTNKIDEKLKKDVETSISS